MGTPCEWSPVQGLPLALGQPLSPKLSPGLCGGWDQNAWVEEYKVGRYEESPTSLLPSFPQAEGVRSVIQKADVFSFPPRTLGMQRSPCCPLTSEMISTQGEGWRRGCGPEFVLACYWGLSNSLGPRLPRL